jgi:uncharacterized membrane protein YdfJ with MMPL/SSD domain
MRKGIVFTMDAVYALYISFLIMSTLIIVLEANTNYSDDSLALARLSRDVYEVKKYDQVMKLPNFVLNGSDCDGKSYIGSAIVFGYNDTANDANWQSKSNVTTKSEKVCLNG